MGRHHVSAHYPVVLGRLFGRKIGHNGADGELNLLGRGAADADIVLLAQVVNDIGGDVVPRHMNTC